MGVEGGLLRGMNGHLRRLVLIRNIYSACAIFAPDPTIPSDEPTSLAALALAPMIQSVPAIAAGDDSECEGEGSDELSGSFAERVAALEFVESVYETLVEPVE